MYSGGLPLVILLKTSKMKQLILIFVICISFRPIFSARGIEGPAADAPPNKCKSSNPEIGVMDIGEQKQIPGECSVADCQADRSIVYTSCGAVAFPDNCRKTPVDLSKPYPKCCPGVKCD